MDALFYGRLGKGLRTPAAMSEPLAQGGVRKPPKNEPGGKWQRVWRMHYGDLAVAASPSG